MCDHSAPLFEKLDELKLGLIDKYNFMYWKSMHSWHHNELPDVFRTIFRTIFRTVFRTVLLRLRKNMIMKLVNLLLLGVVHNFQYLQIVTNGRYYV